MNTPTPLSSDPIHLPKHLEGKLFDVRREDDGGVSFIHPEVTNGLSPERSRIKLDAEQAKHTFNQQYRDSNRYDAMQRQYAPLQRHPKTFGQQANKWIGTNASKAFDWGTSDSGKTTASAGLISALAGGLGGYVWGSHSGEGKWKKALLLALLGGGLGAAGSIYSQDKHQRREAYLGKSASTGVSQLVIRALNNDPTLTGYEKAEILRAIARANPRDQDTVSSLVRTAAGAGIGALIGRFLSSKGLLPMALGGIIGGLIGHSTGGPEFKRNALGQISTTNYM